MTSEYIEKVANFFITQPAMEWEIAKIVKQENHDDFMEIVKSFISSGHDKAWGFNLLFSNDYKRIKKYLDIPYKTLIIKKK